MDTKTTKPVLGFGSQRIIGHWDELKNNFIPISDEKIKEEAALQLKNNNIYPLAVKIMDSDVDGKYYTYRAVGEKMDNPKVILYTYEDSDGKIKIHSKYSNL